jgi:hypothetical protein
MICYRDSFTIFYLISVGKNFHHINVSEETADIFGVTIFTIADMQTMLIRALIDLFMICLRVVCFMSVFTDTSVIFR